MRFFRRVLGLLMLSYRSRMLKNENKHDLLASKFQPARRAGKNEKEAPEGLPWRHRHIQDVRPRAPRLGLTREVILLTDNFNYS